MEKFTVNEKVYFVKELDWAFLVECDKEGIDSNRITGAAALNMFVAYCSGLDPKEAQKEINEHVLKGGSLPELVEIYNKALTESGFFRRIMGLPEESEETVAEETEEAPKKEPKAKKASE